MNVLSRLFGMRTQREYDEASAEPGAAEAHVVPGDRGVSATRRPQSVQTRFTNFVALGLGALVTTSFLAWYYSQVLSRHAREQDDRPTPPRSAKATMALPPLGRIDPPVIERVLGPAPPLPAENALPELHAPAWPENRYSDRSLAPPVEQPRAPDRRLSGEAFVPAAARPTLASSVAPRSAPSAVPDSAEDSSSTARTGRGEFAPLLEPTILPAAQAQVLPTRRLLLPKGSFIDCTLETAINTALPGMTTCVTATDTFSADGSVVLLERGSKLIGETRGVAHAGSNRIFVLWTEARTPTAVVVALASPGTDELGRSGLPGEIDRHFWDRFGAAILISVIDGGVQAAVQRESRGNSITVNPAGSSDIMTEVLKSTIDLPPTRTKNNGDRISILVARDLDFRSVYELRTASDR